jgi:hypothetical protein
LSPEISRVPSDFNLIFRLSKTGYGLSDFTKFHHYLRRDAWLSIKRLEKGDLNPIEYKFVAEVVIVGEFYYWQMLNSDFENSDYEIANAYAREISPYISSIPRYYLDYLFPARRDFVLKLNIVDNYHFISVEIHNNQLIPTHI